MEPPSLGEMSVLKILLFGIMFGGIVRLFYAWCVSGYSNMGGEGGGGGPQKMAGNRAVAGSLDIALLPLADMKDCERERVDAVEEYRSTGSHNLIDKPVLNTTRFPIVLDEPRDHESDLFDGREVQHDNSLGHAMNPGRCYYQVNPSPEVEPVQGDSENEANKTVRLAEVTAPDRKIPLGISPENVPHDCPAKHPICIIDTTGSNVTSILPTSDKLKARTFYGSENSDFGAPNELAAERASTTGEEFWLKFHEINKRYTALYSASSHTRSSFNGYGINALEVYTDTGSQRLSSTEKALAPISTHRKLTSKETIESFKEEEYKPPLSFLGQPNPIINHPFHNCQEEAAISTSDTILSLPNNFRTENEGSRLKPPGETSLKVANPQLKYPQGLKTSITNVRYDSKKTEGFLGDFGQSSLINHRPVPIPFPVPKTLEFTPGSLFRNPRPFGEAGIAQTTFIPPGSSSSKAVRISSSVEMTPGPVCSPPKKVTMATGGIRPAVPQHGNSTHIALQNALASTAGVDNFLIFNPRQVFALHEPKIMSSGPKTKALGYTSDDRSRIPRIFTQKSLVVPGDSEDESGSIEAPEISAAKKRLLQNGSLENPMVGRVKLVSKVPGKDPKFTYLTWERSGVKRSRSPHSCQEKGGCKGCD